MKNGDGASVLKLLQSIDRAIQLFLRLKISEIKGDRNQSDMILLLDSVGFKSGEIIELLGASAGTVRPILSRAHKKKKK